MGMIGISRALVRDAIGAELHKEVRVLGGPAGDVQVHDRTGRLLRVLPDAAVIMQAPDLYQIVSAGETFLVERMTGKGGCGCSG